MLLTQRGRQVDMTKGQGLLCNYARPKGGTGDFGPLNKRLRARIRSQRYVPWTTGSDICGQDFIRLDLLTPIQSESKGRDLNTKGYAMLSNLDRESPDRRLVSHADRLTLHDGGPRRSRWCARWSTSEPAPGHRFSQYRR